jgi:hypothetical protein
LQQCRALKRFALSAARLSWHSIVLPTGIPSVLGSAESLTPNTFPVNGAAISSQAALSTLVSFAPRIAAALLCIFLAEHADVYSEKSLALKIVNSARFPATESLK